MKPLLCGHRAAPSARRRRLSCPECGCYWDLDALEGGFAYGDDYSASRLHYDEQVGAIKEEVLRGWLELCGLDPKGLAACEIGFGGAHTLRWLRSRGAEVMGGEIVDANIARAEELGVPRSHLFRTDALPERLPRRPDLWLFLDSFEHLPDPEGFVAWMRRLSAPGARVLIVAPRADSWSNALLGPLWPHRLPDHPFHWSRRGLIDFLGRRGFAHRRSFYPWKRVTPGMAANHLRRQRGWNGALSGRAVELLGKLPLSLPFNMGQMGLLFENDAHRD